MRRSILWVSVVACVSLLACVPEDDSSSGLSAVTEDPGCHNGDCPDAGDPGCHNGDCPDAGDPGCHNGDCPDAGEATVTICHAPPGNPENAHTIEVGAAAVKAHLAHGDTLGACADDPGCHNGDCPDTGVDPGCHNGDCPDTGVDPGCHNGDCPDIGIVY